jgi:hypothetical protein
MSPGATPPGGRIGDVAVTTKSCGLTTVFPATVTVILPLVAPTGTTAVSAVADAAVTAAGTPLNETMFWAAMAANPVPPIATDVPTGPLVGANPVNVIGAD